MTPSTIRAYRRISPELRHPALLLPLWLRGSRTLARLRRGYGIATPQHPGSIMSEVTVGDEGPRLLVHDSNRRTRPSGAVLWLHGGGLVSGSADGDITANGQLAVDLDALVVAVDYRLAPEHPFPAALDDAVAGWRWLVEQAAELGVQREAIAVAGSSAGAGLAAALCQRLRDEGGVQPCFQSLRYPMLDDRTVLHGPKVALAWTPRANRFGWTSYLGRRPSEEHQPPAYAVPARTADLAGLPPAWIGVGTEDLFHDEDVVYADRLERAGVPVERLVVPGMYHGAEGTAPDAPAMREFRARELAALRAGISASLRA